MASNPTLAQLQQALALAQKANDAAAVTDLTGRIAAMQEPASLGVVPQAAQDVHAHPTRDELSAAFYAAQAAGDKAAQKDLFGRLRQYGMTLAPANAAQVSALDQRGAQQTADAMPWYQQALVGAGKSAADTARGAMQVVGADPADVGLAEAPQADKAIMHTAAGFGGDLAGQLAQMYAGGVALKPLMGAMKVAPRLAPFVRSAVTSGAFNGLQPAGSIGQRLENAGIGAALGAAGEAAPRVLGSLARKAAPAFSDAKTAGLALAKQYGIPLHVAQVSDSVPLKTLASAVKRLPFTGAGRADAVQRKAFRAALAKQIGLDGDDLSDAALSRAKEANSNAYNALFDRNAVGIGDDAMGRFAQTVDDAQRLGSGDAGRIVSNHIDDLLAKVGADGSMPGRAYQNQRIAISNAIKNNANSHPDVAHYLGQVRDTLDSAAGKSMSSEDQALLRTLNGRHSSRKVIEKAMKQAAGADNDVAPSRLWNLVNQRMGSTQGMRDLARMGQTVLKDPIRDSGTAQRMWAYKALDNPLTAVGVGAGAHFMAPTMLPFFAAGAGLGRLFNSPAAARLAERGLTSTGLSGLRALSMPANRALPLLAPAIAQQ